MLTLIIILGSDYYNNSISAVLVSGRNSTSVIISTVDDNVIELNESLILRIEQVLSTRGIINFTEVMQPNSTLIEIIDNDGTILYHSS